MDGPMSKSRAKYWIRRARQGLRDMEEALETGDHELFADGLLEASAAPEEVRTAYEDGVLKGLER